jgi:hypothetical protein
MQYPSRYDKISAMEESGEFAVTLSISPTEHD